jgi:hypothetical protein
MEEKKKTAGQLYLENIQKPQDDADAHEIVDLAFKHEDKFLKKIIKAIKDYSAKYSGSFYVEVQGRENLIDPHKYSPIPVCRRTCPTPTNIQTVYYYNRILDDLELLWTIPSRKICDWYKENSLWIDKDDRKTLNYILDFSSGDLLKKAQKLNGEKPNQPSVIIKI